MKLFVVLFAVIGLACAQDSFWANIAHEIDDAINDYFADYEDNVVDGEDFNRSPFRGRRPADDDPDLIWGSNDLDLDDIRNRFKGIFGDDFPKEGRTFERRFERRVIPDDDFDFDNGFDDEFKRHFKFPEPQFRRSPSEPRPSRPSGPRGPQRPQMPRRGNTFPKTEQDGPTPNLPLNKADCRCRLNTKSRIVNGQEAVKNSIPWQVRRPAKQTNLFNFSNTNSFV